MQNNKETMPEQISQLVFLVGVPRSGTTLLQAMLGRHPRICTLPETQFFVVAGNIELFIKNTLTVEEQSHLSDKLAERMPEVYSEEVRSAIRQVMREGISLKDFMRRSFLKIADTTCPELDENMILLEKTPGHVYCMFDIADIFPEAIFIHIVRNPLDVISSIQQSFKAVPCLSARTRLWNRAINTVRRFREQFPSRVVEVRYEDLVKNPKSTVRNVCQDLQLDYVPAMVRQFHESYTAITVPREIWKQNVRSGGIKDRRGRWKEYMTLGEAWLCSRLTRKYGQYYGYDIIPVDKTESLKAVLLELRNCLFYYSRKLYRNTQYLCSGSFIKSLKGEP